MFTLLLEHGFRTCMYVYYSGHIKWHSEWWCHWGSSKRFEFCQACESSRDINFQWATHDWFLPWWTKNKDYNSPLWNPEVRDNSTVSQILCSKARHLDSTCNLELKLTYPSFQESIILPLLIAEITRICIVISLNIFSWCVMMRPQQYVYYSQSIYISKCCVGLQCMWCDKIL